VISPLSLRPFPRPFLWLFLCAGLLISPVGQAASLNLATAPLANATTTQVLPNIMFTLDDSGSMGWDFMPDWVGGDYPRSSYPTLYKNSSFNVAYYNPAIRYVPPVTYTSSGALDTTTYPSKTSGWTAVKYDAFGKQGNNVSTYPDQLCPNGSVPSGSSPNQTCNLVGGADYYAFVAGEYCTAVDLKTCNVQSAPTATYPFPGNLRWCSDAALTTCQVTKTSTYQYPRYPGLPATATLTVGGPSGGGTTVSSVKVNGQEILFAPTTSSNTTSTIAQRIRDNINACTLGVVGNCQVAGYRAISSGSVVTVTAPDGSGTITFTPVVTKSGTRTVTATAFSGGVPGSVIYTDIVSANNSYPYPGTASKHSDRTDCAGTTCTYNEEMTNFANWFTYYHTRMQMMKSGVSRSFKTIDNKFRVGFNSISYTGANTSNSKFLNIDKFETTHKYNWYVKLFNADPTSSTPLRGALSKVGKIFAKKFTGAADPLQYSCQQNFSILSTDGYWNTDYEVDSTTSSSYGPDKLDNTNVGNLDGGTTPRPMLDAANASNTLADVAKYYYDTDLRTSTLGNCTGALGYDVCENNVFVSSTDNNVKQHMTSFTIGLGADGTLNYQSDYLTATSGDYYNLKNGLAGVNWPNPITNTGAERIDDLWHAAVNGQGQYFSAKNPSDIVSGLNTALASISSKIGSGAAAATSTLNPVAGDNGVFVASYTTVKWTGNLEKRLMNLDTGATSEQASWCAEDVIADPCNAPSYLENDTSSGSSVWYCVTPSQTSCPDGTLVGTDCKVEVSKACAGTLKSKVAAMSDTRNIKMNVGGALGNFSYANISSVGLGGNFSNSFLVANLSQASIMLPAQQALLTGDNLVSFLRGQTGYEDRASNTAANRLFRYREATMGDAVESQPSFIGKPPFNYVDPGYSTYKSAQASRQKVVFLGANDGMLHAFDAENGQELWTYVPTPVIQNLWKLADKNYSTLHTYYVNGSATLGDAYFDGGWHSILVGGLRGGGRGYYALDVTNPASPTLLWEITPTQDIDMGYSFGNALITKRPSDGKWVVILASGYNNTSPGTGVGFIYILDAKTGAILDKISTGAGSTVTPSGLAKLTGWTNRGEIDNTTLWVYGGDLLGNVWRVNMTDKTVLKFAELRDPSGVAQPITTKPTLASINDKRVLYVATGKYLEQSDLTTTQRQTFYAIKDDDATTTFSNPRAATSGTDKMVEQVFTNDGATRVITPANCHDISFASDRGFYLDFPDLYTSPTSGTQASERANIDPMLRFGTLLIPTTVPASDVCAPGGYGWLNFVDYKTGCMVEGGDIAGQRTNSPIVGVNVVVLPPKTGVSINDRIKVSAVTADNPTPQLIPGAPFNAAIGSFQGHRAIWREMLR